MSGYETRPHLGCACTIHGQLTFEKTVVERIVANRRSVKEFNADPIMRDLTKDMFKCNKCDELIHVIVWSSWEDLVLRKEIEVPAWLYWKIKNDRKRGAVRL